MATWVGSPNYDSNRTKIDRIVIHWFGVGRLAGADATFQKPKGTSAHYGIENSTIHQYVKEEHVAYHAGNYAMNQRSIGIEHSAEPSRDATDTTYKTSGKLIGEIARRYNIPLDRTHVIKHSEVKATQCPGTIDLDRLINIAKGDEMNEDIVKLKADLEAKEATLKDVTRQRDELDEARKISEKKYEECDGQRRTAEGNAEGFRRQLKDFVSELATIFDTRHETVEIIASAKRAIEFEDKADELDRKLKSEELKHAEEVRLLKEEIERLKNDLESLKIRVDKASKKADNLEKPPIVATKPPLTFWELVRNTWLKKHTPKSIE